MRGVNGVFIQIVFLTLSFVLLSSFKRSQLETQLTYFLKVSFWAKDVRLPLVVISKLKFGIE
jgi:hypothetical protein